VKPVERDDGQRHDGRDSEERREDPVQLTDGVSDHPGVMHQSNHRRRAVERRGQQITAGQVQDEAIVGCG